MMLLIVCIIGISIFLISRFLLSFFSPPFQFHVDSNNLKCAHVLHQHRLEVWPGYVITVNKFEEFLIEICISMLNIEWTEIIQDLM